jgi:hypothetical protein
LRLMSTGQSKPRGRSVTFSSSLFVATGRHDILMTSLLVRIFSVVGSLVFARHALATARYPIRDALTVEFILLLVVHQVGARESRFDQRKCAAGMKGDKCGLDTR